MSTKRIYTESLSFNAANADKTSLRIALGGVAMAQPKTKQEYQSLYDSFERKETIQQRVQRMMNLGWAGNDSSFYENMNANNVIPKPEDYVSFPFRLISATIVGGGTWKATDFTDAKILKANRTKLDGKGVYKDHETDTNNIIGFVNGTKWSNGFTDTTTGLVVPPGIDGMLAIDSKSDPNTVRQLFAGGLYSNSVTVSMDWEMSHEFEDEWDFYRKVGTMGSDGKMIRRIVKNIYDFHETSIVWLGADPFAKMYQTSEQGDQGLRHIDASSVFSYAKAKGIYKEDIKEIDQELGEEGKNKEALHKLNINCGIGAEVLSLAYANGNRPEPPKSKDKVTYMKFLVAFLRTFGQSLNLSFSVPAGSEEVTLTPEQEQEAITALSKLGMAAPQEQLLQANIGAKVIELAGDAGNDMDKFLSEHKFIPNTQLEAYQAAEKVVNLTVAELGLSAVTEDAAKTAFADLKEEASLGKSYVESMREEAIKLYKATVGEANVNDDVLGLFKKANVKEVQGLLSQHVKGATQRFGGKCGKCGSEEFTFRSSIQPNDDGDIKQPSLKPVDTSSMRRQFDLEQRAGTKN